MVSKYTEDDANGFDVPVIERRTGSVWEKRADGRDRLDHHGEAYGRRTVKRIYVLQM